MEKLLKIFLLELSPLIRVHNKALPVVHFLPCSGAVITEPSL
jgi:hypothetical protein